ncbi:MAG: nicotinate-nucleotide adenylyltransferase [Synergistaceae bacterium]|jgi:nicotinate-nucleotide adenylyltransferase|nr:nicotinate-nucleotide adenylyltransferase [Synergistaceae bacterium]
MTISEDNFQAGREKLGIMGGTFDPIHYGHLFAAQQALGALSLNRVIFVPSGNSPHKSYASMASAEDRCAMTALAIKDNRHFEISRIETDRTGASYTSDTLKELTRRHPNADLFLITGLDAALDIPNWHEPREILSLCTVVTVARPGYIRDKIRELDDIIQDSLLILDTDLIDISATAIRRHVREGGCARYMTPDPVWRYIMEKKLYSGAEA